MLNLSFSVRLPHGLLPHSKGHNFLLKHGRLSKNKSWECQIMWWGVPNPLIGVELDTAWFGEDHAGPGICLELLGLYFDFHVRDNRHWNHGEKRWYQDGEDPFESESET